MYLWNHLLFFHSMVSQFNSKNTGTNFNSIDHLPYIDASHPYLGVFNFQLSHFPIKDMSDGPNNNSNRDVMYRNLPLSCLANYLTRSRKDRDASCTPAQWSSLLQRTGLVWHRNSFAFLSFFFRRQICSWIHFQTRYLLHFWMGFCVYGADSASIRTM